MDDASKAQQQGLRTMVAFNWQGLGVHSWSCIEIETVANDELPLQYINYEV